MFTVIASTDRKYDVSQLTEGNQVAAGGSPLEGIVAAAAEGCPIEGNRSAAVAEAPPIPSPAFPVSSPPSIAALLNTLTPEMIACITALAQAVQADQASGAVAHAQGCQPCSADGGPPDFCRRAGLSRQTQSM